MRRALTRLRAVAHRIRNRGPIILMYHRIGTGGEDPWGLAVSPEHFAEHLEVLARRHRVLPLTEFVRRHAEQRLPKEAVAITFDDGYANNLHAAKPLLKRYGLPATVFVIGGSLDREREFWWDQLGRILLGDAPLPGTFRVRVGDEECTWCLDNTAPAPPRRPWLAWEAPQTTRQAVYADLWRRLQPLSPGEQERVVEDLRCWAGADVTVRPDRRALTTPELVALADNGLVDIGGHTATHPPLSQRATDVQRDEMLWGKVALESRLNRPVVGFSYPYGDHDEDTMSIASALGFAYACTTVERPVKHGFDPFQLPRYTVRDWPGDLFAARFAAMSAW